jgi:hypothetical protein
VNVYFFLKEESAFRFIYLPSSEINNELSGIELLIETYSRHKDKSEIVFELCNLIKNLCYYGKN